MVKTFLIVWTLVAGLAAGSLMYIVGWRPQASSVAQQASSVKPGAQPAISADSPSHQSADADAGPTSTGSIAPSRSATRVVRRVDGVAVPAGSEPAADRAQDVTAAAGPRPNAKPALSPQAGSPAGNAVAGNAVVGNAKRPEIVRLPVGDDAEADPAAQRTQAAERRTNDRGAALSTPIASRSRPEATPVVRPQENGTRNEPDTASASAEATPSASDRIAGATRASDRRAARAAERAARAAARQEERARVAEAGESPAEIRRRLLASRQQARAERRQASTERRSRMARDGGLETLLDEFSRSGADYLHERTIRVGTRYLVERTTRHGTQYFYEQDGR